MGVLRMVLAAILVFATPRLPSFPTSPASRPDPAGAQRCLIDLTLARARYAALPDRELSEGCAQVNTISLGGFAGPRGELHTTGLGALACPAARALYGWARYDVDPAARAAFGSRVARIETYGSYACRNVAGTERRSGHATAMAIDVAAFVLADGRRVSIARDWLGEDPARRQFLRRASDTACRRFGMTLGPNYNAAHHDHLHLELRAWRFCR